MQFKWTISLKNAAAKYNINPFTAKHDYMVVFNPFY